MINDLVQRLIKHQSKELQIAYDKFQENKELSVIETQMLTDWYIRLANIIQLLATSDRFDYIIKEAEKLQPLN
jgi:hypothetical protein